MARPVSGLLCFAFAAILLFVSQTTFASEIPSSATQIEAKQLGENIFTNASESSLVDESGENPLEDPIEKGHDEEEVSEEEEDEEEEFGKITSEDPEFYLYILISTILVAFAGVCSGLTVGYLGITNLQLDIILKNGTPEEKVAAASIKIVIHDHHLLLSTLLLSNAIAMEALPIFLDAICPAWVAILISTVAVVIIGEIVPQAYCTGKYQLAIGKFFAPFTKILMKVLYIFTYPVAKALDKLLGVHDNSRLEKKEDLVGLFELQQLSKEDLLSRTNNNIETQRGLTDEEIKLITSTMLLREKNVTRHMQPYAKIFKLSENERLTPKLMEVIARKGYSNIIVHTDDNKSKVTGILKAKQLINFVDSEPNILLNQLGNLQEPIIISDQTNMLELMMIFQLKKSTVALIYESSKKQLDENVLHKLQDPTLSERMVDAKSFKGFIIGLISLKDVFEVMINKDLQDEDTHQVDSLAQVVKTLEPNNRSKPRSKSNQFASIRKKY